MRHIQTDVLVIGGGATGTGVLRDLAMRGFKCLLVERRDLAYGTTGRYHGLLHSGGRYVVKDPAAARECIEENRILRRIMPVCIEDTGGFFVLTNRDDPEYVPLFLNGCNAAGIPVETVEISRMLKDEPLLDPNIRQCFQVPDAAADSFLAADLNVQSARQYGAGALTYHDVKSFLFNTSSPTTRNRITGVICHDLVKDEDVQLDTSLVINASGAWAGIIASFAGINLQMIPGKGTMVALNQRVVDTVINRCKPPSDGDILVPTHSVAIIGTTDIRVDSPDHYSVDPWEIRLMLDEGEKIIPRFKEFRVLRAWAGIRPLLQESYAGANRDISRSFTLLDHAERDGMEGIVTITSGKWTTYRKMAEVTVDKVCEKLHVNRPCRTHLEELPNQSGTNHQGHYLGIRLTKIEKAYTYGQLICECELATVGDVGQAIVHSNAVTLDDIRRDVRLGMGPCQGAFCSYRTAGLLHDLRHPPVEETNVSLRDFLQERWKGNLPVLFGQQLRQARLNELIYLGNLNLSTLPGVSESRVSPEAYISPGDEKINLPNHSISREPDPNFYDKTSQVDVVIIGAGLSGLITAWQTSLAGQKTHVISKGWGSTYWSTGCIDVLGRQIISNQSRDEHLINELEHFIKTHPDHPYAFTGLDTIQEAIQAFIMLTKATGYPYNGSLQSNYILPTALGTLRPSCLVPTTMIAGDTRMTTPMLIVGFSRFHDFYSRLVADNLKTQGILARDITLDLKSLQNKKLVTGMVLARLFDDPEFRQEVIDQLKPRLGNADRIGFPAVLGLKHASEALHHLETSLGMPVFEIPGLPPSIPGIRLNDLLISVIQTNHGVVQTGMGVSGATFEGDKITSVVSDAAVRRNTHAGKTFILATGGILGGGIAIDNNGYAQETVFSLKIDLPASRSQWFREKFITDKYHPIHMSGVPVSQEFHPLNRANQIIYPNLFAVGNIIAGFDAIHDRSFEGIDLVTGYHVGKSISDKLTK